MFLSNKKFFIILLKCLLVSAIRPSSGHLYIILKTAHMLGILIAVRLGPHETFTSVKNLLQTSVKFPEIYDDMIW